MKEKFFSHNKPVVAIRGIHLDLKGLPPTPERLFEVLDLAYESRINCLLVEWEDTYPWKIYPELKNQTAYSTGTIRKFLDKAKNLNIEIIPLVQSFGHMENVLSKKRFKNLREVPDNVSDLCPLKKESHDTILKMIKDILTHIKTSGTSILVGMRFGVLVVVKNARSLLKNMEQILFTFIISSQSLGFLNPLVSGQSYGMI